MIDGQCHCELRAAGDSDIMWAIRSAEKSDDPDIIGDVDELHNFDAWTDRIIDAIDAEIKLEESSAHH